MSSWFPTSSALCGSVSPDPLPLAYSFYGVLAQSLHPSHLILLLTSTSYHSLALVLFRSIHSVIQLWLMFSVFLCKWTVLGTPPCHLRPLWSTSHPRLWHALGPWSGSRASSSRSPTSLLQVPTTPQSPLRAWVSCTQAQVAGATVGAHEGSGGVRPELPGTEARGQVDPGPTQAAGIIWWNRSATEAWMSSHSCKCCESFDLLPCNVWLFKETFSAVDQLKGTGAHQIWSVLQ